MRVSGTALKNRLVAEQHKQQQHQQGDFSISRSTVMGDMVSLSRSSRLRIAAAHSYNINTTNNNVNKSGRIAGNGATAVSKSRGVSTASTTMMNKSSISVRSAATTAPTPSHSADVRKPTAVTAAAGSQQQQQQQQQQTDASWIAELAGAAAGCMRSLGSHTIVLSVRSDAVQRLLDCLRKAASSVVMESTLANRSDVVMALERLVPLLAFQLQSPRLPPKPVSAPAVFSHSAESLNNISSSSSNNAHCFSASTAAFTTQVMDLFLKCSEALKLIAINLRQLLPARVSVSIAATLLDALLLCDLAHDIKQLSSAASASADGGSSVGGSSRSLSRHSSLGGGGSAPSASAAALGNSHLLASSGDLLFPQQNNNITTTSTSVPAAAAAVANRSPTPPRSVYYRRLPPSQENNNNNNNNNNSRLPSPAPDAVEDHQGSFAMTMHNSSGSGMMMIVGGGLAVINSVNNCSAPAHLSFLKRERHPWEGAAAECLAAVARAMETPASLLPLLVAKLGQRAQLQRQLRLLQERAQHRARRGGNMSSLDNSGCVANENGGEEAEEPAATVAGASEETRTNSSALGGIAVTATTGSGGMGRDEHRSRELLGSSATAAAVAQFVDSTLADPEDEQRKKQEQQQKQQKRKRSAILRFFDDEEDVAMSTNLSTACGGGRSLIFVVELALTLLEDAASKCGIGKAYALFPARKMRLSAPFIIPYGVSLAEHSDAHDHHHHDDDDDDNNNSRSHFSALQQWFSSGGGTNSFLRGTDVAIHMVPSSEEAATMMMNVGATISGPAITRVSSKKQQSNYQDDSGVILGRESYDDYDDDLERDHMTDNNEDMHDENVQYDDDDDAEEGRGQQVAPPPQAPSRHPLDAFDWESGDALSDLWQFFSTVLIPVGAPMTEVQVRALALLYTFFPGDVASLVDKCWDMDDAAGRRRCLTRLGQSPPFPMLVVHKEMMVDLMHSKKNAPEPGNQSSSKERSVVARVFGSGAMVSY